MPITGAAEDVGKASVEALGRYAKPDDIADVTVFLYSDESRFMTGTIADVNGGRDMI